MFMKQTVIPKQNFHPLYNTIDQSERNWRGFKNIELPQKIISTKYKDLPHLLTIFNF